MDDIKWNLLYSSLLEHGFIKEDGLFVEYLIENEKGGYVGDVLALHGFSKGKKKDANGKTLITWSNGMIECWHRDLNGPANDNILVIEMLT